MRGHTKLAAALVALVWLAMPVLAADKGKAPVRPSKESVQARISIEQFKTAVHLAEYGRKEKSAVALLAAAEQLAQAQPQSLLKKKWDKGVADKLVKQGFQEIKMTPETLIAEAHRAAGKEAGVLIAATEKRIKEIRKQQEEQPRGRIPGPFTGIFTMPPRGSFGIPIMFRGGEEAVVGCTVQGGGSVRLTVSENRAGWSKTEQGSRVEITWVPSETARVVMLRDNLEDYPIRVFVWTN
jgi:hypothetical protein